MEKVLMEMLSVEFLCGATIALVIVAIVEYRSYHYRKRLDEMCERAEKEQAIINQHLRTNGFTLNGIHYELSKDESCDTIINGMKFKITNKE